MLKFLVFVGICLTFMSTLPVPDDMNPLMEGDLFQGDIAGIDKSDLAKGLAQTGSSNNRWPGGVVYYTIDSNVYTQTQLNTIYAAMQLITDQTKGPTGATCISFKPRTTQSNYIRIQSLQGCYSNVGKNVSPGAQTVSLQAPGCVYIGTVAHEFIHALGFWHEQSRPDRDNFVTVYYQNIQANQAYNFDKFTTNIDLLGQPYDYNSIMHYQSTAFSANGQPTILPKVSGVTLGNKDRLSAIDVAEIRRYYGCQ